MTTSKVVNQHTELEHTPKALATGYYGIPFIVGERGIAERVCDIGVCCNFLGLPLCFPHKIFGKLSGFFWPEKSRAASENHLLQPSSCEEGGYVSIIFQAIIVGYVTPPESNIAIENRPFEDVSGQVIIIHQPGKT